MWDFLEIFLQLAPWQQLTIMAMGMVLPVIFSLGIMLYFWGGHRRYPDDTLLIIRRAQDSDVLTLIVREDAEFSTGQLAAVLGLTVQEETGGWEEVSFFDELH